MCMCVYIYVCICRCTNINYRDTRLCLALNVQTARRTMYLEAHPIVNITYLIILVYLTKLRVSCNWALYMKLLF